MALGGTLLGVVLDLIGILFSTSGNLLMRWVALRDEKKLGVDPQYKKPKEYLDPLWYLIVILLFGNGATDFAAFQFATMTILAPLASVSIVLNSIVAYFLLGEKFTILHGIGSCIMICGATLTIITGPPEADHLVTVYTLWDYFSNPRYLIFLGIKAVTLILALLFINFVPVLELEKHPTAKKVAADKALQAQKYEHPISGAVQLTDVVTIHGEDELVNQETGGSLRDDSTDDGSKLRPEKEVWAGETQNPSPRKEGDRLVAPCQCPSTPRYEASSAPPSPTRSPAVSDAVAPISRPYWQRFLYTQGHVVVWSFFVSGVGSYTNLFGKIFVKLIAASAAGDMQFTHWGAYLMAVLLIVAAVSQLHCMKICLAKFESIVIMPSLNCMYILHLMCEGGFFFDEFGRFTSELYKGLFALSIIIAFIGIGVASFVREKSIDTKPEKGAIAAELDILVTAKTSPTRVPVE